MQRKQESLKSKNAGLKFWSFPVVRSIEHHFLKFLEKKTNLQAMSTFAKITWNYSAPFWGFQNFGSNGNPFRTLTHRVPNLKSSILLTGRSSQLWQIFVQTKVTRNKPSILVRTKKIHTALFNVMVIIFWIFSRTWGVLVIISVMLFLFLLLFWWIWLFWCFLFFFLLFCKFLPKSCIQRTW